MSTETDLLARLDAIETAVDENTAVTSNVAKEVGETIAVVKQIRDAIKGGMSQSQADAAVAKADKVIAKLGANKKALEQAATDLDAAQVDDGSTGGGGTTGGPISDLPGAVAAVTKLRSDVKVGMTQAAVDATVRSINAIVAFSGTLGDATPTADALNSLIPLLSTSIDQATVDSVVQVLNEALVFFSQHG